jgi:hypothetical protein
MADWWSNYANNQTSGPEDSQEYFSQEPSEMFKFKSPVAQPQPQPEAPSVGEATAKGAAAGGMAAGPWGAAAMGAMSALSAGLARQQQERQQNYLSKVQKLQAQQQALANAQQMASRINYG